MFSMLRINTATGVVTREAFASTEYLLGGRTLSSRLVAREVPATCDPLGRHNKLFFCTGVLAGTTVSSSDRLTSAAKARSPAASRRATPAASSGPAWPGRACAVLLSKTRRRAMPTGRSSLSASDKTEFIDGSFLAGKGVYDKSDLLSESFGKKAGCITIGPTAEKLLLATGIACSDPHGVCSRYAGRGGLGRSWPRRRSSPW